MTGRIARSYAAALMELAREDGNVADVAGELRAVVSGITADAGVAAFLASRQVGRAAKQAILGRVLEGTAGPLVQGLLGLLARRGRLGMLAEVAREFRSLEERLEGLRKVTVTTARSMDAAEVVGMARRLESRLGGRVVLATRVDPALVAGLRVEMDGVEYEFSVEGQLRGIAARLDFRRRGRTELRPG